MHINHHKRLYILILFLIALAAAALPQPANAQATTDCPGAPKSKLVIGRPATIPTGTTPNNLRDKAGKTGKILAKIEAGTTLIVLEGPTCADNIAWWKVSVPYNNSQMGWMAEGEGKEYYVYPTTTAIAKTTLQKGTASAQFKFNYVTITYNGVFGDSIEADGVFGVKDTSNIPDFALYPDYIEFLFNPATDQIDYFGPRIEIYPVEDFIKLSKSAEDAVTRMKKLLTDKPTDFSYDVSKPNPGIPVLPLANAAQVITTAVKYVPFASGEGVRFITYYAQDVSPVTNERVMYYYQGLSKDGKHWISARFPIKTPLLADNFQSDKDFPDLSKNPDVAVFQKYYSGIVAKLNAAANTDFTPTLDKLDALVSSIMLN